MAWQTAVRRIGSGNAGNRETIRAMSALARRGSVSPVVIEAAQNAVRGTPERDDEIDFDAVLRDVRRRMRYTHDPLDAEVVKDPAFVIQRTNDAEAPPEPMDCDDASVLAASMLGALGYPTKFVTVAADPSRPKEWSHVYVVARRNNGRWVALDPIVRRFGVGDEVPNAHVSDRAFHEGVSPMSRLGCYGRNCTRLSGFGEEEILPGLVSMQTSGGPSYESARVVSGSATLSREPAWWERVLDAGSTAASRVIAARKGAATRGRRPVAIGAPAATPGFFQNPDGTTNWLKVGLVGAGGIAAVTVLAKMAKGR